MLTPEVKINLVSNEKVHLDVLDGWRGVSILLVLAAHLLPLGPKYTRMNENTGILGMVFFFVLSGFLITSFLLSDQNIVRFLVRRFFRVIPLAWLYIVVVMAYTFAPLDVWLRHLYFAANLPVQTLTPLTAHLWSICVEVQFYVAIAIIVAIFRRHALLMIPFMAMAFTVLRITNGVYASSISYYRIDEILAGCWLALIFQGVYGKGVLDMFKTVPQRLLFILVVLSCLHQTEWLNYARPYLAALLVGATIANPETSFVRFLKSRVFYFVATISYALYVLHPALADTWLGTGEGYEKYLKRPLLFAVLFLMAYISTRYYEMPLIKVGKKFAEKLSAKLAKKKLKFEAM